MAVRALTLVALCAAASPASLVSVSAAGFSLAQSFGDSMVLRAEGSVVWGLGPANGTVAATLDGVSVGAPAAVGADGAWRVRLGVQPFGGPHALAFRLSPGGAALRLSDVLFGHVYGCGGQSNAWYPTSLALNGVNESLAAGAARYSGIRVMTTGSQPSGPPTPADFVALQQPWARAANASVFAFSAVCWFFARDLVDGWLAAGQAPVPLGLISDNIGGTAIALWASSATLTACGAPALLPAMPNPNPSDGALYDSLVKPLATGPTLFTGWLWWQAEADAPPYGWNPQWYACMARALVADWRAALGGAPFWFSFTQLAPFWGTLGWSHGADGWQEIRDAQLAALAEPNVSFASAVDVGDPQAPLGSYHPRNKQAIGARHAQAARAFVYGDAAAAARWRGPQLRWAAVQQRGTAAGSAVAVTAQFDFVAGGLRATNGSCPTDLGVDASVCADFTVFALPLPAHNWSYLGGGFLGTAGFPCKPPTPRNFTLADARAACEALPPGAPSCPQGCRGYTFVGNSSDPGAPVPMTFTSVLDFFPETGRNVNWQAYGSSVDYRGAKLRGGDVAVAADGRTVTFTALTTADGQTAVAAAYGWATWPVAVLENSDGLPMVPWRTTNVSLAVN